MGCRGGSPLLEIEALRRNALAKARRAEAEALAASPEKQLLQRSGQDLLVAAAVAAVASTDGVGDNGTRRKRAETATLAESCLSDASKPADQRVFEAHAAINGIHRFASVESRGVVGGGSSAFAEATTATQDTRDGGEVGMAVPTEAQLRAEYRSLATAAPGTLERLGGYRGWRARSLAMRPDLAHACALEVARAQRDEAHWEVRAAKQATAGRRFGRLTHIMETGLAAATATTGETSPTYHIGQAAQRWRPPRPVSAGAEWGRARGRIPFEETMEVLRDVSSSSPMSDRSPRASEALQAQSIKAGLLQPAASSSPPPPSSAVVLTDTRLHGTHL
eukprot:COSAG05_NODE_5987_length_1045_cov_0.890063_1_plen_334_part_10